MKILIDISHPAHVHFYKNTIKALEAKGHEVLVTALDKEVALDLLNKFNIDHLVVGKKGKSFFNLLREWIKRDYFILKIAKEFNPDILMGISNPCIAHCTWLLRKESIIFDDTEHASFAHKVTYPFADHICTPSCFMNEIGFKQIRYDGYHELAYLHPNYFKPNPEVLSEIGLNEDDTFTILRFVSWGASHDIGHHGIQNKLNFIRELEKYGCVLITSEADLGPEFEKYKIKVSPEKLHDLLYYATLYIGEGATTASECAILGTHAVYVNTLRLGYTDEEEDKYDLVYNFSDSETMEKDSFNKAIQLLQNPNLWKEGKRKGQKLVEDKIDVTEFMVKMVENYPNIS